MSAGFQQLPDLRRMITKVVEDPVKWRRISELVLQRWKELAMAAPVPMRFRRAYVRCLYISRVDKRRVSVAFDSNRVRGPDRLFARAMEFGVASGGIDMKPWFLYGPNVKHGKSGAAYLDIPMEHTEGARKQMTPTPAGKSITAINQNLKNLAEGERHPRGTVDWLRGRGEHMSPQRHAQLSADIAAGTRKTMPRYAHATDPLHSAFRQSDAYDTGRPTKQKGRTLKYGRAGSIFTFRRVSENSDPRSWFWMRRGFRGQRLTQKMRVEAKRIAAEVLGGHTT